MISGPLAWAVSTQLNYALAPWQCASQSRVIPWIALALAAFSLAGGLLSWRAWRATAPAPPDQPHEVETVHFVAAIGGLMAVLFALTILLQGAAGLVFDGCER